ncbi:unnamed protein product [Polarella glacialis]|uniref:2-phospho-L-lactate guanylyltransferase n=1 Tax=Polarella glacialis TaxID=89957 RepID=A0A813LS03_POLGL|nr:unnamed protein product [Polarella glacialis]
MYYYSYSPACLVRSLPQWETLIVLWRNLCLGDSVVAAWCSPYCNMAETERLIPLCVFAKPPRPGRAKTRLAAKIGDDAACRLACAFISDFISMARGLEWGRPVLATTEDGMAADSFPQRYSICLLLTDRAAFAPLRTFRGDLGFKLEAC